LFGETLLIRPGWHLQIVQIASITFLFRVRTSAVFDSPVSTESAAMLAIRRLLHQKAAQKKAVTVYSSPLGRYAP
jgi:hypothetical protein